MTKFKVGHIVKFKENCPRYGHAGDTGVVVEIGGWIYVRSENCQCGYKKITPENKIPHCLGYADFVLEIVGEVKSKQHQKDADSLKRWFNNE